MIFVKAVNVRQLYSILQYFIPSYKSLNLLHYETICRETNTSLRIKFHVEYRVSSSVYVIWAYCGMQRKVGIVNRT